jgi:hypothetical protein
MSSVFYRVMRVLIHAATTKNFTVREYEVPLLQTLWRDHAKGGVDVMWLGSHQPGPNPADAAEVGNEFTRLARLYRSPEGRSVAEDYFGSQFNFTNALEKFAQSDVGPLDKLQRGERPEGAAPQVPTPPPEEPTDDEPEPDENGPDAPDNTDLYLVVADGPKKKAIIGVLTEAGIMSAEDVQAFGRDNLVSLELIGEKTADKLLAAAAELIGG